MTISSCNVILSEGIGLYIYVDDADDDHIDDEIYAFDADQSATSYESLRGSAKIGCHIWNSTALSSLLTMLKNYHLFLLKGWQNFDENNSKFNHRKSLIWINLPFWIVDRHNKLS